MSGATVAVPNCGRTRARPRAVTASKTSAGMPIQASASLTTRARSSCRRAARDAVATIDSESKAEVRSFPARDAEAEATMVAHVIPIRLSARDIFVRCFAVLALTPMTRPQAPPVELVQSTPAEARVARSLASGKTAEAIATEGGVSLNTVRTHVRHVLAKTGCERQAEVVALLTGIAQPRIAGPT